MKSKLVVLLLSVCAVTLVGCQNANTAQEAGDASVEAAVDETAVTDTDEAEVTDDGEGAMVEENEEVVDEAMDSLVDYQAFVGDYQDSVSQRASAVITENEDLQSAHVEISWANSATSTYLWTMDVTFEDDKLVYTNGEKYELVTDEDGNEETLGVFIEMSGYFEWDGITGNISWTGAEEEECQSCVFVRL